MIAQSAVTCLFFILRIFFFYHFVSFKLLFSFSRWMNWSSKYGKWSMRHFMVGYVKHSWPKMSHRHDIAQLCQMCSLLEMRAMLHKWNALKICSWYAKRIEYDTKLNIIMPVMHGIAHTYLTLALDAVKKRATSKFLSWSHCLN